ncbi:MAG TPA: cell division protein FtsK, partial [Streptosporangiaceae bacterium]|nr:cell division protein FtsK [Streptosporangiaceae bacterium]
RVWEPTPDDPALIIIVDEYAELRAEAHEWADSLARRGRAVAVNLIAATQRPTQDAMGNTAVRSQMDIRICLRVREPRDADLILGQGAVKSGWQAHQLTQPGTFLLSDPEHTIPHRHRAYLISSEQITRQATQHAPNRPCLGAVPQQIAHTAPESPQRAGPGVLQVMDQSGPQTVLWAALRDAGPAGISAGALVKVTGKGRTWVYEWLRQLAANGYAVQTIRGHWRAASDDAPPGAGTPGDPQR